MHQWRIYCLLVFLNSQVMANQTGLLWQVSQTGLAPSYLFGTIHSDDPRVTQLPPPIHKHFTQAATVTIEVEIGLSSLLKSWLQIYLDPRKTLDKLINSREYQQLVEQLQEYGIPEEVTKRLKPIATLIILSKPRSKTGQFLDLVLYQQAKLMKKSVYGLETAEEQVAVLDSLLLSEQVILLKEALRDLEDPEQVLAKLHELYLKRDLTALLAFSEAEMNSEHQEIVNKFKTRLIDERNVRMVERMQPRLQEGNAFIAVGALHLPGPKGLIKLLEAKGYQVVSLY